ncbi:Ger(x)C family spore germination protein [Metabacillus herbersteinensis]|uniref:Ger(X)C family spore germination protein n=1 Tax=Metabacillus herbersteinensis TaxID=283816 RepID=A0ABV6GBF9_9BACI
MKTIKMLLILVMTVPLLSGCWNRIEINDIAIVTAAGLDLIEDDQIRLSLQVAVPTKLGPAGGAGGDSENSTFVISESGATIAEAYRNLQGKLSRRIFFSHSRVLLIGEELAKKGVAHIIDFYSRYHEPRMNSYIMFTKGEAFEVIKNKPKLESVSAEETRELTKLSVGLQVNIKEFLDMLLSDGVEPVAPQFALKTLEVNSENDSEQGQAIDGAAVFKDDKLVGWMNEIETRGILWLINKMEIGVITVPISKEKGGGNISTNIIRSRTTIDPKLEHGELKLTVNMTTEMNVMENASKQNLDDSKTIDDLQKKLETEIKKRVQLALDNAQKEFESDIFGFGEAVYKKYPKEWNTKYKKNWDQEFSHLEVKIKPTVFVRRIGLTK